jgi:RNA-directed DNA polymerase
VWLNGYDKLNAAQNLKTRGYSPKPLRRVYIQKKNGKKRPLSIPCMYDRAMQALFAIALNPVAELSEAISRPKGVNNRRPKLLWVQGKTQLC